MQICLISQLRRYKLKMQVHPNNLINAGDRLTKSSQIKYRLFKNFLHRFHERMRPMDKQKALFSRGNRISSYKTSVLVVTQGCGRGLMMNKLAENNRNEDMQFHSIREDINDLRRFPSIFFDMHRVPSVQKKWRRVPFVRNPKSI